VFKLNKVKGFCYTIQGHDDIDKFAKGILALTNLKSSTDNKIFDIKTYENTNIVAVVTADEIDDYIREHMGDISDKEEITILFADIDDLNGKSQQTIFDMENNSSEYFFHMDISY
jgi:hypothetical protein